MVGVFGGERKRPVGGRSCSVVGCSNNALQKKKKKLSFFSFPARNLEQRELWIKAVNRVYPDGSPWNPTKWSKICSEHFVNGKWSPTRTHPSYVPTIFPEAYNEKGSLMGGWTSKSRLKAGKKDPLLIQPSDVPSSSDIPNLCIKCMKPCSSRADLKNHPRLCIRCAQEHTSGCAAGETMSDPVQSGVQPLEDMEVTDMIKEEPGSIEICSVQVKLEEIDDSDIVVKTETDESCSQDMCISNGTNQQNPDELREEQRKNEYIEQKHFVIKCRICLKTFSGVRELESHSAHAHMNKYKCLYCLTCYPTLAGVIQCINSCKNLMCEECKKQFPNKKAMEMHYLSCLSRKCERCHVKFPTLSGLKRHYIFCERNQNLYTCHTIRKETDEEKSNNVMCKECKKQFPNKKAMEMHSLSCLSRKCERCHVKFLTLNGLKRHYTFCERNQNLYTCHTIRKETDEEDKSNNLEQIVNVPVPTVTNEDVLNSVSEEFIDVKTLVKTEVIDKNAASKDSVVKNKFPGERKESHVAHSHMNKYKCKCCGTCYSTLAAVTQCMHKCKNLICKECKRQFPNKSAKDIHYLSCLSIRCERCKQIFRTLKGLKKHSIFCERNQHFYTCHRIRKETHEGKYNNLKQIVNVTVTSEDVVNSVGEEFVDVKTLVNTEVENKNAVSKDSVVKNEFSTEEIDANFNEETDPLAI